MKIKTGKYFRKCTILRENINTEDRTIDLSFSSEEPYDRYWGTEILDHKKKSVVLDRLNKGGALLMDHNTRDQVGVVEKAFVGDDRKGRALVRFGKSSRAEEAFNDVVDGIRQNVSVGYIIHKMKQEESDPERPVFRATKWEPLEISLVSVPADTSVGVGRSEADLIYETTVEDNKEVPEMPDENNIQDKDVQTRGNDGNNGKPAANVIQINEKDVRSKEKTRVREIMAYGKQFDCEKEAMEAVDNETPVDEFRRFILERGGLQLKPVTTPDTIGMTAKEIKDFSMIRAINALANPNDRSAQKAAGFEFECSQAYGDLIKKQAKGFWLPPDVQKHRDLTVGTDTAGGYTVATNLLAANFIELLTNKMVLKQAGATVLDGLQGDIAIPSQTAGATAYWVAESGAPTESQQTIGQVAMAPKTVGAFTDISRKLLIQSSISVENFVRMDLARVISLALDLAGLHGTGSNNQPTGVAATSGIGSVAGGTNGLAPAWSHIIGLETEVAVDNADIGALAYITNAKVRGKLKQVFTNATYGEIPVWGKGEQVGVGELNGYPAYCTNQVSSALTKGSSSGVCSAIFFGNWADLIIALWSAIDITVDPYTGSTTGTVRVVALQDADIGVRHAVSFAAMLDALTA